MGVDDYWCCIGATLNLLLYYAATGDNYNVVAAQKLNDSTDQSQKNSFYPDTN